MCVCVEVGVVDKSFLPLLLLLPLPFHYCGLLLLLLLATSPSGCYLQEP